MRMVKKEINTAQITAKASCFLEDARLNLC